jgi:hypothetical protein
VGKEIFSHKGGVVICPPFLQVNPDAIPVGRTTQDIRLSVAVDVHGKHVGRSEIIFVVGCFSPEVDGMELPGLAIQPDGLFPPAGVAHHVQPAVAVDVAGA